LDAWILRQLRGQVLSDLRQYIPEGYFNSAPDRLKIEDIEGSSSNHLSFELGWGYLAGTLGRQLYFESTIIMSAREVAASEMLMHLAALAASEAQRQSCDRLGKAANKRNVSDGNASVVSKQIKDEIIPQLELNLIHGLKQYLLHLTLDEGRPFKSLIQNSPVAPIHIFF
jgi:hypothetical protein